MRERSRFETEVLQAEASRDSRSTLGLDLRAAARLNARYARTLGWRRRFVGIARLLDLRSAPFADALARWQKREGLAADGVLGPATWTRMKGRLDVPPGVRRTVEPRREYFTPQAGVALSPGQFGLAFDQFFASASVPQDVIRALAASPTLKDKAKVLDAKYVAASDVSSTETIDGGVIAKGGRRGRPVLAVVSNPNLSAFVPYGAVDGHGGVDVIHVRPPSGAPEEWVVPVALAVARAHAWITRKPRVAGSANLNIKQSVKREALALIDVDRIVSQVFAKSFKGSKAPPALAPGKLEDVERDVERGFHPSDLRHTGLEHWVAEELATAARVARKLTLADIERLRAHADGVPIDRNLESYLFDPFPLFQDPQTGLFIPFDSEYADQRFILRILHARWTSMGDVSRAPLQDVERMREDHASAFFQGVVRYRK
jgi:hypothetical protein